MFKIRAQEILCIELISLEATGCAVAADYDSPTIGGVTKRSNGGGVFKTSRKVYRRLKYFERGKYMLLQCHSFNLHRKGWPGV